MRRQPNTIVLSWSLSAYRLLVYFYPSDFRSEYGDEMAQLFRDQLHAAWGRSGFVALGMLWFRTVIDTFQSVASAYWNGRDKPMFKLSMSMTILYVIALLVTVGLGAMNFGEFYEPPTFSRYGVSVEAVYEDVLIARYEEALQGKFGQYRTFAGVGSIAVTVLLVFSSGLFGLAQKSILQGAVVFAAGAVVTFAALTVMPTIWFPLDRYPVTALWVMGGLPLAALGWAIVTATGFSIIRFRKRASPA